MHFFSKDKQPILIRGYSCNCQFLARWNACNIDLDKKNKSVDTEHVPGNEWEQKIIKCKVDGGKADGSTNSLKIVQDVHGAHAKSFFFVTSQLGTSTTKVEQIESAIAKMFCAIATFVRDEVSFVYNATKVRSAFLCQFMKHMKRNYILPTAMPETL